MPIETTTLVHNIVVLDNLYHDFKLGMNVFSPYSSLVTDKHGEVPVTNDFLAAELILTTFFYNLRPKSV